MNIQPLHDYVLIKVAPPAKESGPKVSAYGGAGPRETQHLGEVVAVGPGAEIPFILTPGADQIPKRKMVLEVGQHVIMLDLYGSGLVLEEDGVEYRLIQQGAVVAKVSKEPELRKDCPETSSFGSRVD